MKHLLLTTIAAVLLVGCGEAQQTSPQPETGSQTAPINSIHDAAKRGDIEAVKQYLADNANVNSKDSKGMTPLHAAAIRNHKEIAQLLIAKGADVNAKNKYGGTPLHYAATKEIAELLIAKGANVNMREIDGSTPLDLAIKRKRTEIADLLRKHGAKTSEELKAEGK